MYYWLLDMNNDGKKNLGAQFRDEDGDDSYLDLHFKKENRRSSNDRREKKNLRKFAKNDYYG